MSFFNQFLCLIMYKIGYLIITPKSYSFGGFYLTIIGSEKIINLKKKKKIFVYLFLNLQEKNSFKIYHRDISKRLFYDLDLVGKFFSIFLTIYLNLISLILYAVKAISKKKLDSILIKFLIPDYIGYSNREYSFDFFSNKMNNILDNPNTSIQSVDLKRLYADDNDAAKLNSVCFCIKDENYNKIKEISSLYCSNVDNCKESINFLISRNFQIHKIGEKMMKQIDFKNKKFKDFCYEDNHNDIFDKKLANCSFYFGSSSSMGTAPDIFNKKKFLINEVDHSILNHSKTTNNVVIFKKIYCSKTKKLFKLNKLFDKNLFSFETLKNSIDNGTVYMEENSEEEILEGMIEFYEINFKNKKKNYILNKRYFEMRQHYLKKYYAKEYQIFNQYIATIPESFLHKIL
jgi:putative glycosyltransferase (TIGR04372 family)